MTATTIAGWVTTWDSEAPRAHLPVRCLDDELAPCSINAAHLAAVEVARATQKGRTDAARARNMRRQDAAEQKRRSRQGVTHGGTNE